MAIPRQIIVFEGRSATTKKESVCMQKPTRRKSGVWCARCASEYQLSSRVARCACENQLRPGVARGVPAVYAIYQSARVACGVPTVQARTN